MNNIIKLKTEKIETFKRIKNNTLLLSEIKKLISQKNSDLNLVKTILKNNTTKFDIDENLFDKYVNVSQKSDKQINNTNITNNTNNKDDCDNSANSPQLSKQTKERFSHFTLAFSIGGRGSLLFNNNQNIFSNESTRYTVSSLDDCSIICNSREKEELEKYIKKVDRFRVVLASMKNKKTAELAYFFFNNACDRMYIIPTNTEDSKSLHLFFEKHNKELSVMSGVIAQILNYLSYSFNIPLKYPMLLNGSKSYIVKNKRE